MILWGFEQWKDSYWSFQGAKWMNEATLASESCAFVKSKYSPVPATNPWIRPMRFSAAEGWVKGPKRALHAFLNACVFRNLTSRFQGTRFTPALGSSPMLPTLQLGSTGPAVIKLQTLLVQLGYPLYVTGTFEAATLQAVMGFQVTHGLVADGIVDAPVWTALYAAVG